MAEIASTAISVPIKLTQSLGEICIEKMIEKIKFEGWGVGWG